MTRETFDPAMINTALIASTCSIIWPKGHYPESMSSKRPDIPSWTDEELNNFHGLISAQMVKIFQKDICNLLDEEFSSLYIDCSKRWEDDILFYILTEYANQTKAPNKEKILENIICGRDIMKDIWSEINVSTLGMEGLFDHYRKQLIQMVHTTTGNNPKLSKQDILSIENHLVWDGLDQLISDSDLSGIYLFLDNVDKLNRYEKTRINTLLSRRWVLPSYHHIRVKINNGKWDDRKTLSTSEWSWINAPRDYTEINISKKDLGI